MSIRADERNEIILPNIEQYNTRVLLRNYILNQWMLEDPDTKYRYFVETLKSGKRIYLERPAWLNKGCDFVIIVEELLLFQNGNDKPPKHEYLLEDLRFKRANLTEEQWQELLNSMETIFDLGTYDKAIRGLDGIPQFGLEYETVLKLLKWFFIEQDITDWNTSGRNMLFNGIQDL